MTAMPDPHQERLKTEALRLLYRPSPPRSAAGRRCFPTQQPARPDRATRRSGPCPWTARPWSACACCMPMPTSIPRPWAMVVSLEDATVLAGRFVSRRHGTPLLDGREALRLFLLHHGFALQMLFDLAKTAHLLASLAAAPPPPVNRPFVGLDCGTGTGHPAPGPVPAGPARGLAFVGLDRARTGAPGGGPGPTRSCRAWAWAGWSWPTPPVRNPIGDWGGEGGGLPGPTRRCPRPAGVCTRSRSRSSAGPSSRPLARRPWPGRGFCPRRSGPRTGRAKASCAWPRKTPLPVTPDRMPAASRCICCTCAMWFWADNACPWNGSGRAMPDWSPRPGGRPWAGAGSAGWQVFDERRCCLGERPLCRRPNGLWILCRH